MGEEINTASLGQLIQREVSFHLREREEEIINSLIRAFKGKRATNEFLWTACSGIVELRGIAERLVTRIKKQEEEAQGAFSENSS